MVKTRALFFWLSGVIVPSLQTLLARALSDCGKSEVNLPGLTGFAGLCERLALGRIDSPAFCAALCEQTRLAAGPLELEAKIRERLKPLPRVLATIELLPEAYERWLVVDLPQGWLAETEGLDLKRYFRQDRQVLLAGSGLPRLMPDVLYFLARRSQVPLEEGLLIDASARRVVQALNHGTQAAIFVDARRMEREFVMRYFIDRPQPGHKP